MMSSEEGVSVIYHHHGMPVLVRSNNDSEIVHSKTIKHRNTARLRMRSPALPRL